MLKYSFMCMHFDLQTARVRWCLLVYECPSIGALYEPWRSGRTREAGCPVGMDHFCETRRRWWNCETMSQSAAATRMETRRNCAGSYQALLPLFYLVFIGGGRSRNATRCFKAQLETKLKTSHSCALLYCSFATAAVPNLASESQFAREYLLLFSGSRLWGVSSKLSNKG